MKKIILYTLFFCINLHLQAQDLEGAWKAEMQDEQGKTLVVFSVLIDGFVATTWYEKESHAFFRTQGGSYTFKNGTFSQVVEFDSQDSAQVGQTLKFRIEVKANTIKSLDENVSWQRVDRGKPGALAGAWLMSGRIRNGQISNRDTNRPRKTMKILSGTRFQWIAYNTETREFKGTGGGTYTTIDGKYTENIDFFSRDATRVGASLVFNYEIKDGKWHHSGKSSKGADLYEIWSKRKFIDN